MDCGAMNDTEQALHYAQFNRSIVQAMRNGIDLCSKLAQELQATEEYKNMNADQAFDALFKRAGGIDFAVT